MPRRKTVQPEPLELFVLENGTEVEIRNARTALIGRGLHKQDMFSLKYDKILEAVFDDYCHKKSDGSEKYYYQSPKNDYLKSASRFAREFALRGYAGLEGDDSALRKRYYPEVMKPMRIYKAHLQQK